MAFDPEKPLVLSKNDIVAQIPERVRTHESFQNIIDLFFTRIFRQLEIENLQNDLEASIGGGEGLRIFGENFVDQIHKLRKVLARQVGSEDLSKTVPCTIENKTEITFKEAYDAINMVAEYMRETIATTCEASLDEYECHDYRLSESFRFDAEAAYENAED